MRPRLPVARPATSLMTTRSAATAIETRAVRRSGDTREGLQALYSAQRPGQHVSLGDEVREGSLVREPDTLRGHRVQPELELGGLERPGGVVDFGTDEAATAVEGVEAVPLREELLQRVGRGGEDGPARAIASAEDDRPLSRRRARRLDLDPVTVAAQAHPGVEVGKVVKAPRRLDGEPARRVEAEEPDPGHSPGPHVRSDIHLGKARQPRYRQRPAQPKPRYAERGEPEPGRPVEGLELEARRDEPPQLVGCDSPVREEQVGESQGDPPRLGRQRPGPVLRLREGRGLAGRGRKRRQRVHAGVLAYAWALRAADRGAREIAEASAVERERDERGGRGADAHDDGRKQARSDGVGSGLLHARKRAESRAL